MKLPAALLLAFLVVSSYAKPTDQLEKKKELTQEPLVTSQPAVVHNTPGTQMYGDEPAKPDAETAAHKAAVNEEILHKFGDFKDNCFPKPSGGCKCNEKDAQGNDIVAKYNSDSDCKLPAADLTQTLEGVPVVKRSTTEEQARANYNKVVQELKDKFKGLKEGCYPRPKGCLCVIGKTSDGRDVTERRMKEADCKCREGQTGNGCPSGA